MTFQRRTREVERQREKTRGEDSKERHVGDVQHGRNGTRADREIRLMSPTSTEPSANKFKQNRLSSRSLHTKSNPVHRLFAGLKEHSDTFSQIAVVSASVSASVSVSVKQSPV